MNSRPRIPGFVTTTLLAAAAALAEGARSPPNAAQWESALAAPEQRANLLHG